MKVDNETAARTFFFTLIFQWHRSIDRRPLKKPEKEPSNFSRDLPCTLVVWHAGALVAAFFSRRSGRPLDGGSAEVEVAVEDFFE